MKRFYQENKNQILKILSIFIAWRGILEAVRIISSLVIPQREGYLGPSRWANFDGVHYLSIAQSGYHQFEQAFFPLFPLMIKGAADTFDISYLFSANIIVYLSLILTIIMFYKLVRVDYSKNTAIWSIIFFLAFPTSFFMVTTYTESLFLLLVFTSFYFLRLSYKKNKTMIYSATAGILASATRLVGVFLLPAHMLDVYLEKKKDKNLNLKPYILLAVIPVGLLAYMAYLFVQYGDPFMFVTSQPAFGAGRSGGEIILLPQVLYRYAMIFLAVPYTNYDFWIAFLETVVFFAALAVLFLAWKKGIRKSYILFSFLTLTLPTLSGTLSSIPRYALASFVIFIFLANIKSPILKYTIAVLCIITQAVLTSLFLNGHFVS